MSASVTPAASDLPDMISVDDHIMEPKDLWQQQLPKSMRERGPRVSRERVKLEFKGGHYGFERAARTHARLRGMPELPLVVVPSDYLDRSDAAVEAKLSTLLDEIVSKLCDPAPSPPTE